MAIKLGWPDLIIEGIGPEEAKLWIDPWSWLVSGRFYPIFLSKFGDWFFRRPDGATEMLDVLEGTLTKIASSHEEFQACVNTQEWQEQKLLSLLIYQLHEDGKIPGPGQCYAVAPHPRMGGKIERKFIMVMDIPVWQSLCAQFCR